MSFLAEVGKKIKDLYNNIYDWCKKVQRVQKVKKVVCNLLLKDLLLPYKYVPESFLNIDIYPKQKRRFVYRRIQSKISLVLVSTKLMRSVIANCDLAIGDARLAADDCRSP